MSCVIDGIPFSSRAEEAFYRQLQRFMRTLDPDTLPLLAKLYDDLAPEEKSRPTLFCLDIEHLIPDVIIKETFVRVVRH